MWARNCHNSVPTHKLPICCMVLLGKLFPLEAHIVCTIPAATWPGCGPDGCTVVIGIMFELSDDLVAENAFLKPILDEMPMREGVSVAQQHCVLQIGVFVSIAMLYPRLSCG